MKSELRYAVAQVNTLVLETGKAGGVVIDDQLVSGIGRGALGESVTKAPTIGSVVGEPGLRNIVVGDEHGVATFVGVEGPGGNRLGERTGEIRVGGGILV